MAPLGLTVSPMDQAKLVHDLDDHLRRNKVFDEIRNGTAHCDIAEMGKMCPIVTISTP